MESQVLTPGPGQTIVASETHRRHDGHHDHCASQSQVREGFAFGQVQARDNALASTQQVRAEFNATIEQIRDAATASALASCKSDDATASGFFAAQKQVSDAATSTLVGFKDLTALSYQVEGRALLEAAKNASLLGIQADRNYNALNVEAVKNAAASVLEAQKNAAAVAMQIAECCCETQKLIIAQGVQTRDLISANTLQDQRDRAARAEAQLASLFARNVAPVVPGAV